jgi:hypothetical protein
MKKVIVGLAAVGALIALRSVAARGGHEMSGHCKGMGAKCKEMMASQSGQHGAAAMREHCQEKMAAHTGQGDKAETPEHPEPEAPQFVGNGEAVAV